MKKTRPIPFVIVIAAVVPLSLGAPTVEAQQVEAPLHERADRHHDRDQGYLGVSVRPLNTDLRRHFGAPSDSGVLISSVEADSPAQAAGLAVGDVIVGVNGHRITSVAALHREIRRSARAEIDVYRDGEPLSFDAELGQRRVGHQHWETDWEDWAEGWAEWGERWGEDWAEWGERFGEHWAEFGAEMGEEWGERGAEWGEIGAEIGARMAEAFAEMDWSEMDRALEESMRALDEIDWDEIGDEIEDVLEEVDETLEDSLEDRDDDDG